MPEGVCAVCKHCYLFGVMGFDGQSIRCKLSNEEVNDFDTCDKYEEIEECNEI